MLKKRLYIILLILCLGLTIQAQTTITIGGNVYGGGNEGDLGGCTSVVVREGDLGSVYAGARQANISGNTFVNIDGEHMSGDILINYVYGGNDIAGTIGSLANLSLSTLPSGLTKAATYGIDNTYNCFVLTTKEKTVTVGEGTSATTSQPYKIFIGQLFGGGNGDYTYDTEGIVPPEIDKAYIEMRGGSCVLLYGGGNNVTVRQATDICIDNPSTVTDNIYERDADGKETTTSKLTDNRLKAMGIYQLGGAGENVATSDAYQFSRVFGGNNKAPMAIRPKWHLEKGKIRNLYSGGNRGAMTYEKGIYLAVNSNDMEINNVYGGCRMADVNPDKHEILEETIEGVLCPAGYAARVHIGGGNINNVYGGNDISGTIYGGNAVGIHSSINKDVYGGGNGSYPYTDNPKLANSDLYGDYYYTVPEGKRSVDALNDFRPNAEAVSVRLIGPDAEHPTIIGGSVYCGGNSATLRSASGSARAQLKIGAYVYADKVFLGSNGENMVKYNEKTATEKEGVLRTMASIDKTSDETQFNSIKLVGENNVFADYMKGCEIGIKPEVVFDTDYSTNNKKFTTYFGSFYCGGNVGSVNKDDVFEINFNKEVVIFDKVVGGSNDADVKASDFNAPYQGGLLGSADATTGDKLRLTFNGLKIEPKRWKNENNKAQLLEWNLNNATSDEDRRLLNGNIYGGCYNSGHVNGNVVINIESSIVERDELFDAVKGDGKEGIYYSDKYDYTVKEGGTKTGVQLGRQGMDVEGAALNVFGGGYGKDSEIWGSTTINLKKGYAFQLFGGGEKGAIGKKKMKADGTPDLDKNGEYQYEYNPQYSTYINIIGTGTNSAGVSMQASNSQPTDMPECEFVYGGGFEGLISGDTHINLGNGRVFNTFAGSCNADLLGHTETYIGKDGFPWVRDHVYGGNDLGGSILNLQQTGTSAVTTNDFVGRVNVTDKTKLHKYNSTAGTSDVFIASAYMEYVQGRVDRIFGGCYGDYDYDTEFSNVARPYMDNTFVNFRPNDNAGNAVSAIFGAGQGATGTSASANLQDAMQDRSYILINIPDGLENYKTTDVFGAGACCGVGMRYTKTQTRANTFDLDKATAIVDLIGGHIRDAYGSSYEEGFTRRTMVNVPAGSTIHLYRIFGGGYGLRNSSPCDTYEAIVNYSSSNAVVGGYKTGIFGGNNNCRRTLYSKVNINAPTWSDDAHTTLATVFGAGLGENTWSQYTEVNLNDHAQVYEVYGGGNAGMVLNAKSVNAWNTYTEKGETKTLYKTIGNGYDDYSTVTDAQRASESYSGGLGDPLVKINGLGKTCNSNVYINKGAVVSGYIYDGSLSGAYAYGGGYGETAIISGSTYVGLHGGTVVKDIYASGSSGGVQDKFKTKNFVATANAFVAGGMVRNVFGGGWMGDVGYHEGSLDDPATNDILGEANVVVGIRSDQTDENLLAALKNVKGEDATKADFGFYYGEPAIQRNAYSGGEGGAVYGTANLTINNGYIGYVHLLKNEEQDDHGNIVAAATETTDRYEEKLNDETYFEKGKWAGKNRLSDCGNAFGGGYDVESCVDKTNVTMWGGLVRNSLHGGGEIATVGRGATKETTGVTRTLKAIYQSGETHVTMYNGHVKRNVFGGGKGYNIWGYGQLGTRYTDGYVFGKTEVCIHGGEIGTAAGVADGYGNVFGGGDIGYVYSKGFFDVNSHKTGTGSPNHFFYYDGVDTNSKPVPTEDCKVVVSPYLQVRNGTIKDGSKTYNLYDYVPTEYLNKLPAKQANGTYGGEWQQLFTGDKIINSSGVAEENPDDPVERGVTIHNAVFGGGNVSSNSETYANATTVFGNTTATLYDVYYRDFITVGTEHVGGLYGGGNLSVVDGYRELNITNYGTDYHSLNSKITLEKYQQLTNRERAYFQLQYQCQQDVTINDKNYKKDDRINEDEYNALPSAYQTTAYWTKYGFCSIYAGRLLNTIQRADFCGVFGSRMVLQGAKDRVADVGDATVYTINRVGELSLNKQRFDPTSQSDDNMHGNYFGIYSVVNYMGNLTSDVKFEDKRQVIVKNAQNEEVTQTTNDTYYQWKVNNLNKKERNIGTCCNQVALASGVFLELTTENSTSTKKDYGYITGIVELDLINVKKDIVGGGYVYAKNVHGEPSSASHDHVLLSEYNRKDGDEAFSYKFFTYNSSAIKNYETSGNFIHRKKRIIDDCYPNNGVYNDDSRSPAHYWYIKGEVYVYDQNMSAYAGSTNAYSKEVKIPLSITAGSNGKLKLLNVQPSLYAYYTDYTKTNKIGKDPLKVDNETMTFNLNDVISWWDWSQLTESEQKCFVKETLVNAETIKIGINEYAPGEYVMLPSDLAGFNETMTGLNGQTLDKNEVFHPSNNIGHDKGYVLTVDWDTPKDWADWYSPKTGNSIYNPETNRTRIMEEAYDALSSSDQSGYREGPTYRLKTGQTSSLYGQKQYGVGAIISEEVYTDYTTTVSHMSTAPSGQASVEEAYVAKETKDNVNAGSAISKTAYNALTDKTNYDEAWLCINTIQYGEEEYIFNGDLVANGDLAGLANKYKTYINGRSTETVLTDEQALDYVKSCLSHAYYCKSAGLYGGQYYEAGENYSALKAWCALTDDRNKFDFNYDALDVLADKDYSANPYFYQSPYCDEIPVDYKAAYTGGPTGTETLKYTDGKNVEHTLTKNSEPISRIDYETYIPNDQRHYTQLNVPHGTSTFYIVTEHINNNGTAYAKGQELTESEFNNLSPENKNKVSQKSIINNETESVVQYFCLETYADADGKRKGDVIEAATYIALPNEQKNFIIQGMEPTETTTLYVSRESTYKDVTKEKIITVVYQYSYIEDEEGEGVSQKTELHVLNIHLNLESGVPQIGKLNNPPTVKPGETVGLKAPSVNPGLYEIIINGWELFPSEDDALNHRNGVPFVNNGTPLYWYQNKDYHIAFYSKTYLGKTYSDPVPVSVANYHDLTDVLADKKYHLHVDYDPEKLERDCKIYINDAENGAQQLKSFIDLSYGTKPDADHEELKSYVRGGANLDFILRTDITQTATWTPIANGASQCFEGTLHGDGHSINGLDNSLFGSLCGDVYNLGVTGSFTGAGIAEKDGITENDGKPGGYLENCWVKTTGTVQSGKKALFGHPTKKDHPLTNCYYPTENGYTSQAGATAKPLASFGNGEVAYNLNGFYLYKRYCDNKTPAVTGNDYQYMLHGVNGLTETTGHYESQEGPFLLDQTKAAGICYVENRYADGDFIYANGTIPQDHDVRMKVIQKDNKDVSIYYPIWPDDYLFFGQSLTYDYVTNHDHQDEPSAINKNSFGILLEGIDANRVYRAEGYFGSSTDKKPVHFNPYAVFAKNKSGDTSVKGYEGMTAIDLMTSGAYASGSATGTFYPPLLDDDGITRFRNIDLTRNLLVYTSATGTTAATAQTDLPEPVYEETNENYRTVDAVTNISNIQGHWVNNGTATVDHLLVDGQDFNAPISYKFNNSHRMWYQRLPNNYVTVNNQGKSEGWEDISLPFEVKLVTTQTKGELTHFYSGSTTGHEYWLRQLTNIENKNPDDLGIFQYPSAADYTKEYKNTYLWDHYYKHNSYADAHSDSYQGQYYASSHNHNFYPLQQPGKPYLIGFPGSTYYEFDLSGQWTPEHTSTPAPSNPGKQTITFASNPGITIAVSDTELRKETINGYQYCANYASTALTTDDYVLNSDGSKYTKLTAASTAVPFHAYFKKAGNAHSRGDQKNNAENVLLSDVSTSPLNHGVIDEAYDWGEDLEVRAKWHKIVVKSHLREQAEVRIVSLTGIAKDSFTIQPGETIESRITTAGVYIVQTTDDRYVKKIAVK